MEAERQAHKQASLHIADTAAQDVIITAEPGWRRHWPWMAGLALVLVVLMLLLPTLQQWLSAERSFPWERVRTATVTRGDLIRDASVQGRVVAAVSPTLFASADGTITLLATAGARVAKGDELATIDSPELTNLYRQNQARLTQLQVEMERTGIEAKQRALTNQITVDLAQLALTAAQRESQRATDAFAKDAISQIDYQKAQDELESARYAHTHAVADADLDSERLAFETRTKQLEVEQQSLLVADLARQVEALSLRSPVDGVVGNLLVDQKANVARNAPVMAVVDLGRFEVEAQIPQSYADDLAIGMAAEVRTGSQTHAATIASVSPEIIDNQVTIRLRFDADTVPGGLRQNQRLTTRVLFEKRTDVLMVERGQFLEDGGGRIAYLVDRNVAQRTSIQTGARSLSHVEINGGLEQGDVIVTSRIASFENASTVLLTD